MSFRGSKTPVATYSLIAINVVVYLVCVAQARSFSELYSSQLFVEGVLFKPSVQAGEYWRLLTSGFLHFSVTHIALNMISLFILGRDIEKAFGTVRFLTIYTVALLGGSAAIMLFAADNTVSAGASGAIYGLMGAALVMVLRMGLSAGPIVTLIVINVVFSFTVPGISIWAHLGGLVFGAGVTALILARPHA